MDKKFGKNWWACNFFAIWLRMLISFLNEVDKQLILEFKYWFRKYHLVFPKNPYCFFFLRHKVYLEFWLIPLKFLIVNFVFLIVSLYLIELSHHKDRFPPKILVWSSLYPFFFCLSLSLSLSFFNSLSLFLSFFFILVALSLFHKMALPWKEAFKKSDFLNLRKTNIFEK